MANNPLYPGYKPKKEGQGPLNPIYPGYYVGGPMSKNKPIKDYLKPMEYNFDKLIDGIDEIGNQVANTPILSPKWYVDRVVDDWKGQLKVSVSPKVNIDPTELDDYATDDLAGATTTLSLNLKDWGIGHEKGIEQTKAQIKKTLNAWVKEATGINRENIFESDFSDIQNRTNEELWNIALGYKEDTTSKFQKIAADEIAQRTTLPFEDVAKSAYTYPSGEKHSPLDLKHRQFKDANGNTQIEEDTIYRELASKVSSFQRGRDDPRSRDKLHTDFLTNTFYSIRTELKKELESGGFKIETPKQEVAINLFNVKVDTLKEVEKFQKSISDIADHLEKETIIIKGSLRTQSDKKTEINKLLSGATQQDGLFDKTFDNFKEITKTVRGLGNSGVPQQEIDFLLNDISKYESRIKSVRQNIVDAMSNDGKNIRNLAKELRGSTPDKNFTTRTTFQDNLAGNLRKNLEKSIMSNDEYSIGNVINDPAGSNLRARKIAPLVYRMRQDRIKFAAKEVLNSFERGGLSQVAETYVWNEIKKRMPATLERVSSGAIIGDRLKRSNYYGLKMDERGIPTDEFFKKNPEKLARFERKFGNRATIQLDDRLKGLIGDEGKGKIVLSGSEVQEHLKIIGDPVLNSFKFDKSEEDQILFARLINNDRSEDALDKLSLKIWGKSFNELDKNQRVKVDDFFGKIDKTNKWVYQKSEGKIKTLDLQNSDNFKVFKNNQIGFLTQKAVNQKDADTLILKMFKLDGDFGPKERKDVSLNKLYRAITGKDWDALSEKEKLEWVHMSSDIKKFSEWMITQNKLFGDKVNDPAYRLKKFLEYKEKGIPVNVDQNDKAFLLIKNIFDKNNKLNDGYKLTDKKYLGRLERINNKLQSLQIRFNKSKIGKLIKIVNTWQKLLAEKIVKLISKLIAKITGITIAALTGPLAVIAPILQAVVEKVIERGIKYAQSFIKGIFKMDFKDLDKMLREDFKKLVQLIGVGCGCLFLASIPGIALFALIATNVNPIDSTRDNYDGYTVSLLPTSGEPDPRMFTCSTGRGSCNVGSCSNNFGQCDHHVDSSEGSAGFYYSQCDPRWGGDELGNGPAPEQEKAQSICSWGCLLSSIAMVSTYFGQPVTPKEMNEDPNRFNYQEIAHYDIPDVNMATNEHASPGSLAAFFRNHPNGEGIAILQLKNSGGVNCLDQHWVVITGMCGNDFIMYDPYSGPDVPLSNVYEGNAWGRLVMYWVDDYCISFDDVETSCLNGNEPAPICSNRPGPTGNRLADTALDIACDLRQGFGCLYNRPAFDIMDPKYSHSGNVRSHPGEGIALFDFELWAQYGNGDWWDSSLHNHYDALFWCTWLPIKVYNDVYGESYGGAGAWLTGGGVFSLGAFSMCDQIQSGKLGFSKQTTPKSGDVVCFDWAHVGVVYNRVDVGGHPTGVWVAESNGYPLNYYSYSNGSYAGIRYFGRIGGGGGGPTPE